MQLHSTLCLKNGNASVAVVSGVGDGERWKRVSHEVAGRRPAMMRRGVQHGQQLRTATQVKGPRLVSHATVRVAEQAAVYLTQ